MSEQSVFDRLVRELSNSERRDMLDRLEANLDGGEEPLVELDEDPPVDLETQYRQFGFLRRLTVFLRRVFGGKDRETVVEEMLVRDLGRSIQHRAAGLLDSRNNLFLPALYQRLRGLASELRVPADFVRQAVGAKKADFLAFLTGLEVPEFQQAMLKETDPYRIASKEEDAGDARIKKRIRDNMEEIFLTMSASGKRSMYQQSMLLQRLVELTGLSLMEVLSSFEGPTGEPEGVPVHTILPTLRELDSVLSGMNSTPSKTFVEALVLFSNDELLSGTGDEVESTVGSRIRRIRASFDAIRAFARQVPLRDMVRYASGEINYRPDERTGGEEWLSLVRRFWEDRSEEQFRRFSFYRRRRALLNEIAAIAHVDGIEPFPGYTTPRGAPGKYAYSLAAVRQVVGETYQEELRPALRILLVDGEFYKPHNRAEFDAAINTLQAAFERVEGLARRLRPASAAPTPAPDTDPASPPEAPESSTMLDKEIENYMKSVLGAFRSVALVTEGVLYGQVGGKYDTISNLGQIAGRGNKEYRKRLDHVILLSNSIYEHLGNLFNLESLGPGAQERS